MSLVKRIIRPSMLAPEVRDLSTIEDYAYALQQYNPYGSDLSLANGLTQTYGGQQAESINVDLRGLTSQAYKDNGVVFAVMLARLMVFSAVRFRWQRYRDGKPSDTFGGPDLAILDRPWTGGTTQDLLTRMIQDADLAGNAFIARPAYENGNPGPEMVRLRPDWVDIVVEKRMHRGAQLSTRVIGYLYYEGGKYGDVEPVALLPDEVCHFAPNPDPLSAHKGMSWLTPIIREVQADKMMTRHQRKFFENGATPNMVIKHPSGADPAKVKRFAEMIADEHGGIENAYRALNLYPGADMTVVGSDFRQIDFKQVRGGGETRIAAAGGVPPIIVGLSEGLQAATYSNYGQARRRFADGTMHPLWQNASGSLEKVMPIPGNFGQSQLDVRLWYDATDVPFLREDSGDQADIAQKRATTIKTYVDAGFTPESAIKAVNANDERLLVHTGLVSVQLLPPGPQDAAAAPADTPPADAPDPNAPTPQQALVERVAKVLPSLTTGTGKVIKAEEARELLNKVGAGLSGDAPEPPAPPPTNPPPNGGDNGGDGQPPPDGADTGSTGTDAGGNTPPAGGANSATPSGETADSKREPNDRTDPHQQAPHEDWHQRAARELVEGYAREERYNANHGKDGKFAGGSGGGGKGEGGSAAASFPPIRQGDLSNPDTPRTREVSQEEFDSLASEGRGRLAEMRANASPADALEGEAWSGVKDKAWNESRSEWGGATIDGHTGEFMSGREDAYAMTVRPAGKTPISVSPNASREEFDAAMEKAKGDYAEHLSYEGSKLGVFHDADVGRIDIDPVVVVKTQREVETIGSYTKAVGGAYKFSDGLGYWPPYVKE